MNEFASTVERHRRDLLVHGYRMLGSVPDAEDAVQDSASRLAKGRRAVASMALPRGYERLP